MTKTIEISDNVTMLSFEVNAARVFVEAVNDKMNFMAEALLEAENKLCRAEQRCAELKKLLGE